MTILKFEIRGAIPGTKIFSTETFTAELGSLNNNDLTIAIGCALSKWVNEMELGDIRAALINILSNTRSTRFTEILKGTIAGDKGYYRISAKIS